MRLVKLSILGALLAVASSALLGSTASANTELCLGHEELACTNGPVETPYGPVETTHAVATTGTVVKLLGVITVLCLGALAEATALENGSPQELHATTLSFTGCGTGSSHNNCTVSIEELPSFDLLKTGLDEGTLTATNGQVRLVCSSLGLDCLYDTEGLEFSAGAQHITAEEVELTELGGKFLCPNESSLDSLLEPLESAYVLQDGAGTALCSVPAPDKAEKCPDENVVKTVHYVASNPLIGITVNKTDVLFDCEEWLMEGTVGKLGAVQEIQVTALIWKCKSKDKECTIQTKDKSVWKVSRTAQNKGTVLVKSKMTLECDKGKEIDCEIEPSTPWEIIGASTGTHHGRIKVLGTVAGKGNCPEAFAWNATYEALANVYVLK